VQRAAAEVFVSRHANVDYFPSYEFVMLGDPKTNWSGDFRHVHPKVVNRIMTTVMSSYLDDPALAVQAISDDANQLYGLQEYAAMASLYAASEAGHFSDLALYRVGLAFKKLGRFQDARNIFAILLARDPGNVNALRNMSQMEQHLKATMLPNSPTDK
jgi:tetratricopeptide (TPR) repeat protein